MQSHKMKQRKKKGLEEVGKQTRGFISLCQHSYDSKLLMHHQFHTIETCKSRETIVIYSVQYTEANLIECGLLLYLLVLQFV